MSRLVLQIETATCLDQVDALRPEWDELERRTPEATGFQSFAWCRQWLACAADEKYRRLRPRVVSVRAEGRLVMLWPVQIAPMAGLRVARWVGEPMTQYGDALAEQAPERSAWRAAAESFIRGWRDVDLVLLRNVREDGVLGEHSLGAEVATDRVAPFLDLADPRAASVIAVRERGLRRRQRRLAASGPIGLRTDLSAAERVQAVQTALALKRDWLRRKRLFSSGLSHPLSKSFLERLAADGNLATSVLLVADTIAAVELGIRQGTAYRSLLSTYDIRLAAGAPGHALTMRLIAEVGTRGICTFDFLAPCDDYKLAWSNGRMALRDSALALTWRGYLGVSAVRLRPQAKWFAALLARLIVRLQQTDISAERATLTQPHS